MEKLVEVTVNPILKRKINEIVDWIVKHGEIREYTWWAQYQKEVNENFALKAEMLVLKKETTVDYIDKLHYICKYYKNCDGCTFYDTDSASDDECRITNKSPEWWPEMKEEIDKAYDKRVGGKVKNRLLWPETKIDKAYDSLIKQNTKSGLNGEISEVLPENAVGKHVSGLWEIFYKLFEYISLPLKERDDMELIYIRNKLIKAINYALSFRK